MPLRNWKIRISDIIEATENVLEYSKGMTFESFITDQKTADTSVKSAEGLTSPSFFYWCGRLLKGSQSDQK